MSAPTEQILNAQPHFERERLTEDVDIGPREAFLLTRCDGTLTVSQLASVTGNSTEETVAMLQRLVALELVQCEAIAAPLRKTRALLEEAAAEASDEVERRHRGQRNTPAPMRRTQPEARATRSRSKNPFDMLGPVPGEPGGGDLEPNPAPAPPPSVVRAPGTLVYSQVQRLPTLDGDPELQVTENGTRGDRAGHAAAAAAASAAAWSKNSTPVRGLPGIPRRSGNGAWRDTFTSVPVSGDLVEVPFYRVMTHILAERLDGVLTATMGRRKKSLYFVEGQPVYATSNMASETLGQLLVRSGKLAEGDRDESYRRARQSGRLQGEVLVEMRCLSKRELDVALRWQSTLKILDVFGWREGQYRFDGDIDVSLVFRLQLDVPELLVRGFRKQVQSRDAEQALEARLDDVPAVREAPLVDPRDLRLSKSEQRVLDTIAEKPRRTREIYSISPMLRGATSMLLHLLAEIGVIEFRAAETERARSELSITALERRRKRLKGATHFDVLGAHPIATQKELDAARDRELKLYDPARLGADATPEQKTLIEEARREVEAAYAAVEDPIRRKNYRRDVIPVEKLRLFAELQYRKGEVCLFWKMQFTEAVRLFRSASELDPKRGGYVAHLGLALTRQAAGANPRMTKEGMALIEKGISLSPDSALPYMCLGVARRDRGDEAGAQEMFRRAVACENDSAAVRAFIKEIEKTAPPKPPSQG